MDYDKITAQEKDDIIRSTDKQAERKLGIMLVNELRKMNENLAKILEHKRANNA